LRGGLALVLALFIAPVTAVMAGLFLDEIAEVIETRDYPGDTPGRPMPLGQSVKQSLGFLLVVGLGNIVALLLLLVPGINIAAFFLVNGYLLGREYFEFAAMRFMSPRGRQAAESTQLDNDLLRRPDHRRLPLRAAAQPADPDVRRRHDGASAQDDCGEGGCGAVNGEDQVRGRPRECTV
jgi:Flp pilus assembly protein TadB